MQQEYLPRLVLPVRSRTYISGWLVPHHEVNLVPVNLPDLFKRFEVFSTVTLRSKGDDWGFLDILYSGSVRESADTQLLNYSSSDSSKF